MNDKPIKYITFLGQQGKAVEGVELPNGGAAFDLNDMSDAFSCTNCGSIGYEDSKKHKDKCIYCDNPAYPLVLQFRDDLSKLHDKFMNLREEAESCKSELKAVCDAWVGGSVPKEIIKARAYLKDQSL